MTIEELIKKLNEISEMVDKISNKPDREGIDEVREVINNTAQDYSDLSDVFLEDLFEAEMKAIEEEIKRDEEGIEEPERDEDKEEEKEEDDEEEDLDEGITSMIEVIKDIPMSVEDINQGYKEREIVDAGKFLNADVKMRYSKIKNCENLHKAIFN